jgi:hypothetical protein
MRRQSGCRRAACALVKHSTGRVRADHQKINAKMRWNRGAVPRGLTPADGWDSYGMILCVWVPE